MKTRIAIVLTCISISGAFYNKIDAQIKDSILMVEGLENIHKVDNGVYRSEQPTPNEFKELEKVGIKEVLNLRRFNSDDDEAEDTDLVLHRIKSRAEALSEHQLLQAMKIIKNRKGNILIHCKHGSDRTGAVVATYRIVFQDWAKEDAINEMRDGGYGFHGIFANIPKLIEKIDVEEFKKKIFVE